MAIAVDDIIRFGIKVIPLLGGYVVRNIINYRVHSGATVDEQVFFNAAVTAVKTTVYTPMKANLPTTVGLASIGAQKVSPILGWPTRAEYSPVTEAGTLTSTTDEEDPRRAACLIRRNYHAGRPSIGRFFFGPLDGTFLTGDHLYIDPTGDGDLRDVASGLTAELSFTSGADSMVLRPCIIGQIPINPTAQNDVRTQYWSLLVSYMRSRKVGRGE